MGLIRACPEPFGTEAQGDDRACGSLGLLWGLTSGIEGQMGLKEVFGVEVLSVG